MSKIDSGCTRLECGGLSAVFMRARLWAGRLVRLTSRSVKAEDGGGGRTETGDAAPGRPGNGLEVVVGMTTRTGEDDGSTR